MSRESADNYSNERSLPIDLVRDGRIPPVARSTASRKPDPSTSAQCIETQIAEARCRRQHRSIAVCRTLWHLPQGTRRAQNPQARDRPALASRGFSGVLALEITIVRRPAKDARGHSSAHSRDKRCQPAVGSAAGFTANYASLASMSARRLSKIHGKETVPPSQGW